MMGILFTSITEDTQSVKFSHCCFQFQQQQSLMEVFLVLSRHYVVRGPEKTPYEGTTHAQPTETHSDQSYWSYSLTVSLAYPDKLVPASLVSHSSPTGI